jgi:hypothetical protein
MSAPSGPVEDGQWREALEGRAVDPTDPPRLWGYDVHGDLAAHYRLAEVVWLAATGELPPDERRVRALECALTYLMPVSVLEGPAHAATVAQLCRSGAGAVASVGALTLAQEGQWVLDHHEPLWAWLRGEAEVFPEALRGGPEAAAPVARFRGALERLEVASRVFEEAPGLHTAVLAVLFELGFTAPHQLLSLWMYGRLPCVLAEAYSATPGRMFSYPLDLPHFRYEVPHEG